MVRLKGARWRAFNKEKIISIPYGAIKSTPLDEFKRTFFEFQFLMVRLKEIFISFERFYK